MVDASLRKASSGVVEAVQDMDLRVLAPLALLATGGLILSQELVQQVLPRLGFQSDPQDAKGLGASAAVKVLGAVVLVGLAMRVGGSKTSTAAVASGVLAYGMVASAGMDLVDVLQRGGLPGGQAPVRSSPTPSPSPSPSPSQSTAVQRAAPAAAGRGTSTDGYR